MHVSTALEEKANEIIAELKLTGLWKKQIPAWVTDYEEKLIQTEDDFLDWLQFVYLPNCATDARALRKNITLQAIKFFKEDVKKGRLLQLLIELDSL
jgi:uncharacterized protein YqcC (DUF446 family)